MNLNKTSLIEYAHGLLAQNIVCVPINQGGKLLDLETMGYTPLHLQSGKKRMKDLAFSSIAFQLSQHPPGPDTLAKWFEGYSGNIGVIGGYSNVAILDFDRADLYEVWRKKYPDISNSTPTAKSPRGFHVYLRTLKPEVSSSLHFGFRRAGHIKALGGYVLSPPSQLQSGENYQWIDGQSPFEVQTRTVESLKSLSLFPVSPLKDLHDRIFNRGGFDPI